MFVESTPEDDFVRRRHGFRENDAPSSAPGARTKPSELVGQAGDGVGGGRRRHTADQDIDGSNVGADNWN